MRALRQPPQTLKPATVIGIAAFAGLGLAAGAWVATQWRSAPPPAVQSGVMLGAPRPLGAFALSDHEGRPFANAQLQGRWSVVFAGFTHCPDVCPTTLGLLKAVAQQLGAQAPAMIFLSVDPERDTPAVLKQYVQYFGPAITGVTGPHDALDRLCQGLGIAYVRIPGATDADYTVDHSAALVLVDPQGRVAGYFTPPLKADTLAADLSRIVGAPS